MTDTPTTPEEMREEAAGFILDLPAWRFGLPWVNIDLAHEIRCIPCAPDPRLAALEAERDRLREALRIIAGDEQGLDNLMSNAEVARVALKGGGDG